MSAQPMAQADRLDAYRRFLGLAICLALATAACGRQRDPDSDTSRSIDPVICTTGDPLPASMAALRDVNNLPLEDISSFPHSLVVDPVLEPALGTLDPNTIVTETELSERYGLLDLATLDDDLVLGFVDRAQLGLASCYLRDGVTGWELHSIRLVEWSSGSGAVQP